MSPGGERMKAVILARQERMACELVAIQMANALRGLL
jgi:hypothetical protein